MTKENYYALVSYGGRNKYYYVSASDDNPDGYDIRLEYIDYNPNREWLGVWIKNGNDKIISRFVQGSKEYEYFTQLKKRWNELCLEHAKKSQEYYKLDFISMSIGISNYHKYWKQAVIETPKPLGIIL